MDSAHAEWYAQFRDDEFSVPRGRACSRQLVSCEWSRGVPPGRGILSLFAWAIAGLDSFAEVAPAVHW